MSIIRSIGLLCLSTLAYAQIASTESNNVIGELRVHGQSASDAFIIELYDSRMNAVVDRTTVNHGHFQFNHVPAGSYAVRVLSANGGPPLVEEYHDISPGGALLFLDLPEHPINRSSAPLVSLSELQHPIPKKALHEAYEADQLARAHDLPKAIAKLQKAIQIDPLYRDAHVNLGVQYARTGRMPDARAEFQTALNIGPPVAEIYVDLALATVALGEPQEAEKFARKALELEPENREAHRVLQAVSFH